ncbi:MULTISPECIES: lipopolysaccharide assembly protein LapA domain-containing protein [Pseudoalteromonas]|uniref:Membrane protein n=1 Tax=Pseudoalteromonas aurantia 208 TaxID=1314867 RepID=A0ABR9EDZ1_9GAMM|nr:MULTISPECIES: LapA family protein [Pseudoalteromonas]MBE0367953.1 putative membrane protein [Pseudoalteromonas aurantia 208]MBQ4845667.1 LapA family protein [Pseudoalteromonas sp. MMG005]MBQ4848820.1 LapA family protein [Pseudoalteromonas sp. MMG012]
MVKVVQKGFVLALILLAFVIGTQNPEVVNVNYLIATSQLPLATLMSVCFFIGVLIGCMVSVKVFSQLKWQNYRLKKSNRQLSPDTER